MVLYERRHDGVDNVLIFQTLETVRAPVTRHDRVSDCQLQAVNVARNSVLSQA